MSHDINTLLTHEGFTFYKYWDECTDSDKAIFTNYFNKYSSCLATGTNGVTLIDSDSLCVYVLSDLFNILNPDTGELSYPPHLYIDVPSYIVKYTNPAKYKPYYPGYGSDGTDLRIKYLSKNSMGAPYKVFFTKQDALNYFNRGKTYIPRINVSLGGLHIKPEILTNNQMETVISNVINNNHYDYSSNDEINIQNSLDTNLNLALSDLFGDGSDPVPTPTVTPGVNPTPTPGFGDGDITPTPIPDEDSEVSSWLQLIYESLSKFIESWGKYGDSIYKILLESNVKLDDIITAFDQIGSGDVSGISGNCKYDYSALSAFLTQLWSESDKKLDSMIALLEENNEYQQKLLDSLNQIKALLVADTVMDFFKDRSNETANKAKEKFPSSIPWDIAVVVNAMCAEPEDPVIRCPITISSLGIHEEIVIDLSSEEWAKLAKTCRSLLSILFILYLVHLSRELFFKGGDD